MADLDRKDLERLGNLELTEEEEWLRQYQQALLHYKLKALAAYAHRYMAVEEKRRLTQINVPQYIDDLVGELTSGR